MKTVKSIWGSNIPENSLIYCPGDNGNEKTLLSIQLCLAISSGWDSFCGERIEKHGNTLLLNFKLNDHVIKRRMHQLFQNPPEAIDQVIYQARVYTSRRSFMEELSEINSVIEKFKPVVVFIDDYEWAFNKEATQAMSQLLTLRNLYNCSIVLNDNVSTYRRSTFGVKSDLADGVYFLNKSCKNKSFRILKRKKSGTHLDLE